MAIQKTATAVVADLISFNSWEKMQGKQAFGKKTAAAKKVAEDHSKFILSHCTIMASVMTEEGIGRDHLIKSSCCHLVNSNDDAWENNVLQRSYRSFVGAFNFLEHKQETDKAKGHILDAVLRKVATGPDTWVYYVDILVATDLTHESLVADIRSQKMKYMSMGCITELVICSFCGARCTEPHTYCPHLTRMKGELVSDDEGIARIVAELCGHKSLPNGGVKFVEASWVSTPAFPGAANRSILIEEWVGPKTPYTHVASTTGMRKAASGSRITAPSEVDDPRIRAALNRLL
jgi:hypothetical protein